MFTGLLIAAAVGVALTGLYAALVAFGSRVTKQPYDPGYDTRRPRP